jgi:hypothetical protein
VGIPRSLKSPAISTAPMTVATTTMRLKPTWEKCGRTRTDAEWESNADEQDPHEKRLPVHEAPRIVVTGE